MSAESRNSNFSKSLKMNKQEKTIHARLVKGKYF